MAESVGSLLRRYRSAAGLTQEELAEKAEVSARTVSDVERGLRTRIYRDTSSRLADALALQPHDREAFLAASRGRGSLPAVATGTLPIPPTRLIGRDPEVELVCASIADGKARLVTLTGPGGIGKTRIAIEAAHRLRGPFEVLFVELGSLHDPAHVVPAIRHGAGAQADTASSIAVRLAGRHVLVVLDTFEHVLRAAEDVAGVLAAAPDVAFLVTSREALRIRGEHEVAISTLPLPESPATLDEAPATALFLERARAVGAAFEDGLSELVLDICRKLNGLPLAIELAAARTKHLSLEELQANLHRRLDVLTGGPRDLPRRQRTMRDAIAWSVELLDKDAKRLFADLSSFAGGWTLEAAAAVGGREDILEGISALVDKSLVRRMDGGRYDMLDVVHDYASETAGSNHDARERHLDYFILVAEEAEPALGARGQREWMARLAADHDNIRTALRRALDTGHAERALRLASTIWRFWLLRSDLAEGRQWLRAALDLAGGPPVLRAKALWGAAWLAYHSGDYEDAERMGNELTSIAETLGQVIARRNAFTVRGLVELAHARPHDAVRAFGEAVDLVRDTDAGWLIATSFLNVGIAKVHATEDAEPDLNEARRRYEALGDEHFVARCTVYSGYAALVRGDVAEARERFRRSLVDFWELDDLWGTAEALEGAAAVSAATDDVARAARMAGAASSLRERTGGLPFPADRALTARWLDAVKSGGPQREWETAFAEGRSMTADESVSYALS